MTLFVKMEQAALLHHQLPCHNDYSPHPDTDCIEQLSGHAQSHHPSYASGGVADQLRRERNLGHTAPNSFDFFAAPSIGHSARFVPMPDRAVAADGFHSTTNFTDSSSGSISTSPCSAASSLGLTNYPVNHYTGHPIQHGLVQLPQTFIPNVYAGSRVPSILDGSGMLPPPSRLTLSPSSHAAERDAYGSSTTFLARTQLSPPSQAGYPSYTTTPRSVHMASTSSHGYGTHASECANFPWPTLEVLQEMTCEGSAVTPEVHAKIEKGFFLSPTDNKWTCYRRNYFSVNCSFELHPHIANGRLLLKRGDQVQAMGIRLAAAVDATQGKSIDLVQHTPKRDNGPKNPIVVTKVTPSPPVGRTNGEHTISPHGVYQVPMSTFHATGMVQGPFLPLQNEDASSTSLASLRTPQQSSGYGYTPAPLHLPVPGQNTNHTFERVQFKSATANNGKRRASQQYFLLVVELYADVRRDGAENPNWVKVAQRTSDKIVVRGRSPSHYSNEGQHGPGSSAGRGGSGSGGSTAYGGPPLGYSSINSGGFRASGSAYRSNISGTGGYRRGAAYAYNHSPEHSDRPSSGSGSDGGAMEIDHPMEPQLSESEQAGILNSEGYRYYPSAMYEGMPPPSLPSLQKMDNPEHETPRFTLNDEYSDVKPGAQWQAGGCTRYQGMENSRGYYPDLHATY